MHKGEAGKAKGKVGPEATLLAGSGFLPSSWDRRRVLIQLLTKIGVSLRCYQWNIPQNMARNMVLTYLHKLDPEDLPISDLTNVDAIG